MPDIFSRVKQSPNICSIELAFNGDLVPSTLTGWQPFFNNLGVDCDFTKTYVGLGSVSFNEDMEQTKSGELYKQKISIRLPSTDPLRAERLQLFKTAKYVKANLTNGLSIVIGRNDYHQNAKPKIAIKSNQKLSEIEFETVSIFPTGFIPNLDSYGLPSFLPLTLL